MTALERGETLVSTFISSASFDLGNDPWDRHENKLPIADLIELFIFREHAERRQHARNGVQLLSCLS